MVKIKSFDTDNIEFLPQIRVATPPKQKPDELYRQCVILSFMSTVHYPFAKASTCDYETKINGDLLGIPMRCKRRRLLLVDTNFFCNTAHLLWYDS
ncbi:hypothetical protein TNCV_1444681 [Trichonephila clavipes]|nr:hypothetical protein TNCV_1444681 [Trichonephila clavipes]